MFIFLKKKKKKKTIKAPTMPKQKKHRLMVGSNRPGPYKAASKVWTGRFADPIDERFFFHCFSQISPP